MTSLYNSCFHIHVCLHVICVRKNSRLIDNVFMYNKPYLTSCLVIKSSLELLPLLFLPIYPFLSLFRSEATSTYYFVRLPGRPYVCLIWQLPRWALPLLLGELVSSHIVGLPFDHLLFHISPILSFIFLPLFYSLSSTHPYFRNPSHATP